MLSLKFIGCFLFRFSLKLLLLIPSLIVRAFVDGKSSKMIFNNKKSSLLCKIFPLELLPCRSVPVLIHNFLLVFFFHLPPWNQDIYISFFLHCKWVSYFFVLAAVPFGCKGSVSDMFFIFILIDALFVLCSQVRFCRDCSLEEVPD